MRRFLILALCLLSASALAGCAAVGDQLHSAAAQSLSAVQSARLAVQLDGDGRSTAAFTGTTLTGDALKELSAADATVSELDISHSADGDDRQETLNLIRESTDAVNSARQVLNRGGLLSDAEGRLGAVAKKLSAQSERLATAK